MTVQDVAAKASKFLLRWRGGLLCAARLGPVLDVACGDGRNGLALALAAREGQGEGQVVSPWFPEVLLVDRSPEAIGSLLRPAPQGLDGHPGQPAGAQTLTGGTGPKSPVQTGLPPNVTFRLMDLETSEPPSFGVGVFGVVLVFRYLHRPLIPVLRDCLAPGGMLACETYLEGQEVHGKPRNPDHLLRRGELEAWFGDWEVLELYEGELESPPRVMGRVICRKPSDDG